MINFSCCARRFSVASNGKLIMRLIAFTGCPAWLDIEIFNCSPRDFGQSSGSRSSSDKDSKGWLVVIGPKNLMRRPVSILIRFANSRIK
ncbi:uncharacterized protein NPIL_487701 [Nephila pilipes]|uniref:Uncharacterized protein n=1 Tax=Nephila pilipes TaxID=299642 RepID=A0A8X6PX68_NEPPI|nr:uncharacterized protein NPIL_487701 [Nephila pilipes]